MARPRQQSGVEEDNGTLISLHNNGNSMAKYSVYVVLKRTAIGLLLMGNQVASQCGRNAFQLVHGFYRYIWKDANNQDGFPSRAGTHFSCIKRGWRFPDTSEGRIEISAKICKSDCSCVELLDNHRYGSPSECNVAEDNCARLHGDPEWYLPWKVEDYDMILPATCYCETFTNLAIVDPHGECAVLPQCSGSDDFCQRSLVSMTLWDWKRRFERIPNRSPNETPRTMSSPTVPVVFSTTTEVGSSTTPVFTTVDDKKDESNDKIPVLATAIPIDTLSSRQQQLDYAMKNTTQHHLYSAPCEMASTRMEPDIAVVSAPDFTLDIPGRQEQSIPPESPQCQTPEPQPTPKRHRLCQIMVMIAISILVGITMLVLVLQRNKTWPQVGQTIEFRETKEQYSTPAQFGAVVAVSANGTIIALSAPRNGRREGFVRVYSLSVESKEWLQMGQTIVYVSESGFIPNDDFGAHLALSDDGTLIAIGASDSRYGYGKGYVQTFQFLNNQWLQFGTTLEGDWRDTFSRVALSGNGNILAVGAPHLCIYEPECQGSGYVQVYRREESSRRWVQMGRKLGGMNINEKFGFEIVMSSEGNVLAIRSAGERGESSFVAAFHAGTQRNLTTGLPPSWSRIDTSEDGSGIVYGESLALSADGSTLAYDEINQVTVTKLSKSGQSSELDTVLSGEDVGAPFRHKIALSGDGKSLVVATQSQGSTSLRAFGKSSNEEWKMRGSPIQVGKIGDMALSKDGTTIVVGTPWNESEEEHVGQVRILLVPA